MTPDQALAVTRAQLDQTTAMERDAVEGVPTCVLIGAQLIMANQADWDATLAVIATGPAWLRQLACMATMNSLGEAVQRELENDLLPEKTDGNDLA